MHIGFLNNQLDRRGTGNAIYNYAHYNEEILGNKSTIYTFANGRHDPAAHERFKSRFKVKYVADGFSDLDALYHIKSGINDGFSPGPPYLVHSVFDNEPHGTVYATVSPWMSERFKLPFVPHIVELFQTDDDLRAELGIPEDATVFGRHGGIDSFDISIWHTIYEFVVSNPRVYFVFLSTAQPHNFNHERVIFLPSTVDPYEKRRFINTCNAFIHASRLGETFGIAVGEFAIAGKPIITHSGAPGNHLYELGTSAYLYNNKETLLSAFNSLTANTVVSYAYQQYTPEKVMIKFEQVFLSGL